MKQNPPHTHDERPRGGHRACARSPPVPYTAFTAASPARDRGLMGHTGPHSFTSLQLPSAAQHAFIGLVCECSGALLAPLPPQPMPFPPLRHGTTTQGGWSYSIMLSWSVLVVLCAVYFVFAAYTSGVAVPAGGRGSPRAAAPPCPYSASSPCEGGGAGSWLG